MLYCLQAPDVPMAEVMSSPSTTDDSHLQDIEGFNFFKQIPKSNIGPEPEQGSSSVRTEDGDEILPPSHFNEDSISSMDIDLAALENVSNRLNLDLWL